MCAFSLFLLRSSQPDEETNESKVLDQYALPFGAIQAVYAWDRVAAAITHIVRYFAVAPCSRYVDDLFGVTWSHGHGFMTDFIKWLVMKLGFRLAEDKTPPASEVMVILGKHLKIWTELATKKSEPPMFTNRPQCSQ